MAVFSYDPEIVERFRSLVGGVIMADGVVNGPSPPELVAAFAAEQRSVRERIGEGTLSMISTSSAEEGAAEVNEAAAIANAIMAASVTARHLVLVIVVGL